jgi:sulfate adenylyltransferase subunit 1 (EFTu-like GTPase family)
MAAGVRRPGDRVMALPSCQTSRVKSIVTYDSELAETFPPQAVTVTLEDEIDVSRGDLLAHADSPPWWTRASRHTSYGWRKRPWSPANRII